MSTVTIAWLAFRVAPAGRLGLFVGLGAPQTLAASATVTELGDTT